MSCVVPQNQPIYQALLDKAVSYLSDKPNLTEVYKKAANSVANYNRNIYQDYAKYDGLYYALPFVGGQIEELISNVVSQTSQQSVKTCVVPQNQLLYQALLNKAASYDGNMIYLQRVFETVADAVAKYNHNIYDYTYFRVEDLPINDKIIGNNAQKFIDNFILRTKTLQYTPLNPRRSQRIANNPKKTYIY